MSGRVAGGTAVCALALVACAAPVAAADVTYAYLVKLGADTLSLERVTRTPTQVRGEYVVRTPRTLHRTYVLDLAPDGTVRRFEQVTHALGQPGAGTARETRAIIEFLGDSAVVTAPRGDSSVTSKVASGPGAVPSLTAVMGIMDQIAWQARRHGAAPLPVPMVPVAGAMFRGTAVPVGADSVRLDIVTPVGAIPPFWLVADPEHRLLRFSGHGSVFQAEAERIREPDFAQVAAAFATRPIGALSTRDTVRATLAGAELWLDYGRPSRRGREIFGNVVPWDQVWRTGANAATQFRTSVPLTIGGKLLPAGTYSLWTLPGRAGWQLILNAQTGQWGTQYDPARDVLRVKLASEPLAEPVEQLTVTLEAKGAAAAGGALVIRWDRTRLSVPIAAGR